MACDVTTLLRDARCAPCLSPDENLQVQTFLLASLAGVSTDPNVLMRLAACFSCMSIMQLMQVKSYLLCQFAGDGGGSPTPPPVDPCEDAVAAENLAGSCYIDAGQIYAEITWDALPDPSIVDDIVLMRAPTVDGIYGLVNATQDGTATSLIDPSGDLESNTTYFYKVIIQYNIECPATESEPLEVEVTCELTAIPVNQFAGETVRGADPDGYTNNFTWDNYYNQAIVTDHTLERADNIGGPYAAAAPASGPGDTGASDDGALLGIPEIQTTYFYRVTTTFNNGCPPVSTDPIQIDTGCHPDGVINYQVVGDPTTTTASVEWTPDTQPPILDYVIFWGTSPGDYDFNSGSILNSETTYDIADLTPSTQYYSIIRIRDSVGCFIDSDEITFTTADE